GFSYSERLREALPSGLRIGFSPDLGYAVVQSEVASIVEQASRTFEALGHRLVPIEGGPPELGGEWGILGAFEIGSRIAPFLPHRASEFMRGVMDAISIAAGIDQRWWGEMSRKRAELVEWVAATFERVDLLLTPTVPYDPPPCRGPFPAETEGRRQVVARVAAFTSPFN